MKVLSQLALALLLGITMLGNALALDGRLLFISTSPERHEATLALWQKDGIVVDDQVILAKLYPILKAVATDERHPAAELSDQAFAVEMAKRNPGLPATGVVKVDVLRFMAQGNGIFLPTPAAVAAVQAGTSPLPVPAPAPVVPVASSDGKQAVALANLEGQVKELKAALAKSGAAEKQLSVLSGRLTALGKQVEELQSGQSGLVQKTELGALTAALSTLQGEIGQVAELRLGHADTRGRLSIVEQNPILQWGEQLYYVIGSMLLLALGVAAIFWRRISGVKQVASEAKVVAEEAKEGVKQVRAQAVLLDIVIPEHLDLELRALVPGTERQIDVLVDGERFPLSFTKVDDTMVKVAGIRSQHNAVRIDNVVSRIKRAAGLGDLVGAASTKPLRAA